MSEKLYILILALIAINTGNNTVFGQDQATKRILAKILVEDTTTPVPFAFVANSKTGIGKETNEKGVFRIDVDPVDTLLFRCMGFEDNSWALSELNLESDTLILNVHPKSYALDEINVLWFRSYAAFKSKLANMPMMATNEYKLPFTIDVHQALANQKAESGQFSYSFSVGGKSLTREEKQYHVFLAKEKVYERFNTLTSKENLKAFTNLEGEKLDSFIVFLRSKHQINPRLSEYDMMVAINQVYEKFLAFQTDTTSTQR